MKFQMFTMLIMMEMALEWMVLHWNNVTFLMDTQYLEQIVMTTTVRFLQMRSRSVILSIIIVIQS